MLTMYQLGFSYQNEIPAVYSLGTLGMAGVVQAPVFTVWLFSVALDLKFSPLHFVSEVSNSFWEEINLFLQN